MKKKLLAVAGITAMTMLPMVGCATTPTTIVIYNQDMKEVQRIQADDVSPQGDGATIYYIKGEKHRIENIPHDIITKVEEDDE